MERPTMSGEQERIYLIRYDGKCIIGEYAKSEIVRGVSRSTIER